MSTLTKTAYQQMTRDASPRSRSAVTIPLAFVSGGLICALGQAFINLYMRLGLSEELAPSVASVTLVFLAALLTGLNVFDDIAKYAGAGTLVPITGFSNAMTAPALEFKSEGYIMGVGTKLFSIAGPVIVYGLAAGVVYGLIAFLFGLY